MPFCNNCGAEIPGNAKFCNECGATLTKTKSSPQGGTQTDNQAVTSGQTIQRDGPVYGIVNLENLPAGHIIDERYEVKEKLGQGGFGAVYRAYDRKMKVDKALKVIPEAITNDLRAMENLRQEARTMIRLNHNILYGFTYLPLNSLEMLKIVS